MADEKRHPLLAAAVAEIFASVAVKWATGALVVAELIWNQREEQAARFHFARHEGVVIKTQRGVPSAIFNSEASIRPFRAQRPRQCRCALPRGMARFAERFQAARFDGAGLTRYAELLCVQPHACEHCR